MFDRNHFSASRDVESGRFLESYNLRLADPENIESIIDIFSESFADDPLMIWMLRPGKSYRFGLSAFFRYILDVEGFPQKRVIQNREGTAFAIWIPSDEYAIAAAHISKIRFYRFLLDSCSLLRIHRFYKASRISTRTSPSFPHYYLHYLCVRADCRGSGAGTKFLSKTLELFDLQGIPTYLEVSNPKNVPFYSRLGYRSLDRHIYCSNVPDILQMARDVRGR